MKADQEQNQSKLDCQGGQSLHQHFGIERPECCRNSLNEIFQGLSSGKIVKYNGLTGNLFEIFLAKGDQSPRTSMTRGIKKTSSKKNELERKGTLFTE